MIQIPEHETRDDNHLNGRQEAALPAVADDDQQGRDSMLGAEARKQDGYLVFLVCAFLLLAVWFVFGQTLRHQFVSWDDGLFVYSNPQVKDGLTLHGIAWAFRSGPAGEWYPLAPISHMLDCQLYGLNPSGHHLTSVLLHATAAIVLFLAMLRMTGDMWPSAFVAALFAIHPLHVESVAWIAERRDVLSGLFFMLTLWMYADYVRQPSRARYVAMAVLFALGLMAKPMLVTLPFVLLLLDYWPLGRFDATGVEQPAAESGQRSGRWSNAWRLVVEKIPLLVLAAVACGITLLTHVFGNPSIDRVARLSWGSRVANALVSCVAYLGQLFFPVGLAPFYPHPGNSLPMSKVAGAAVLLTAITTCVIVWRRKCPYLLVGWFWYLGMLVPVLGLLQVGRHSMADRYTYLSQIGLYVALTWGAADFSRSWPNRLWVLGVSSAVVLSVLMGCAWQQTSYWRDDEALWTHALACTAPSATAEFKLGVALFQRDRLDEAIAHYEQALKIDPDFALPHNNLGVALHQRGKLDEAIMHYRKALEIDPDMSADSASTHFNLADALAAQGKLDDAIVHFEKVLKIDPADAMAHNKLAHILARQGKVDEAIAHYEQALKITPDDCPLHNDLACELVKQGKNDEAIAHLEKALKIDPKYAPAHNNLANILARQEKFDEAITHYEQALRANANDAAAHNNLANALLAQGKRDEAIAHYERALKINPNYAEARTNLDRALDERQKNR